MFSEIDKPRGPGRPRGRTRQGEQTRAHLYDTAVAAFAEQGYEATTLRGIAKSAGVSPGLLYRYFPSKVAVVLELYEQLSAAFAARVHDMPPGRWAPRAAWALQRSLAVLGPHRDSLRALTGVLVADPDSGLFSAATAFSRRRVQGVFEVAVTQADNAPEALLGAALGRLLYLLHLGVVLWWLLDKSPGQRATSGLVALLRGWGAAATAALWIPGVGAAVRSLDALVTDGLLGPVDAA